MFHGRLLGSLIENGQKQSWLSREILNPNFKGQVTLGLKRVPNASSVVTFDLIF